MWWASLFGPLKQVKNQAFDSPKIDRVQAPFEFSIVELIAKNMG
jgi:hypothetical protein